MMDIRNETPEQSKKRRDLLKTVGVGGIALALSGFAPLELFKPDGNVSGSSSVSQVENVASLLAIKTSSLKAGDKFIVGGYYKEGDGGAKLVTWNAESTKADNGGTVHNPFNTNTVKGRFEVVHNGTGDYRWFGIFDETKAADDAFLAMVYDDTIVKIEAHSNLLFKKRNRITRSRINLNFNGYKVFTYGIETGKVDDPFGAVFFFTGEVYGKQFNYTLANDMHELWDTFEVDDATKFTVGEWYTLMCDANAGGREDKELQKMTCVVEIVDSKHVRFDYKLGWPLKAGRIISFQHVRPVFDVRIENMLFEGAGRPTTTAGGNGSNPVAFEYAVRCDVYNLHGTQVFWPLIERRYNTYYVTEKCSLYNPIEVQVGGTGYLTQQIYCLYGAVRDCHTSKPRHLNDFTGSAYCIVENCHCSGDNMGPFVTHGQYEHDLTYIGNSGLFSLANSGATWGESAKRIVVKKHVGTRVICWTKITDLTLEDVHVFYQEGATDNSGSIWANVDGLVMRNCDCERMLSLSCRSLRTSRPNVIENCTFKALQGLYFGRADNPVVLPVTFKNCNFLNVNGNYFAGSGDMTFENCYFEGSSTTSKPIEWGSADLRFINCKFNKTGVHLTGTQDQKLVIDGGTEFFGACSYPRIALYNFGGQVTVSIGNMTYTAGAKEEQFIKVEEGVKVASFKMVGATINGGTSLYANNFLAENGFLLVKDCIENGYTRGALPAENGKVSHSDNLMI